MKRFITILTLLICVVAFPLTGYAAPAGGHYSNIVELYEYWEANGYPDYVGGVFSTDGDMDELTVLLTGDAGAAEAQIRAMLSDDSGVSFGTAAYSHNELMAVSSEIATNYLGSDDKVYGVGVGWTSVNGVVSGFGESGKESRVVVSVDASVFEEYTGKFQALYGDMVVVEASGTPTVLTSGNNTSSGSAWLLPLIIAMALIAGGGMLLLNRARLIPALQTTHGAVAAHPAPVSREETIAAVKNSETSPGDEVLQSILRRIDKNAD